MTDNRLKTASSEVAERAVLPGQPSVEPEISIVVPAYNHRRFALDLLESISRQENTRYELVLVDDGSTDGSFDAIVERAKALGLAGKILRLGRNAGRSTARNAGIGAARAQIIAFTDADCEPSPRWLAEGLLAFTGSPAGVIQGRTGAQPRQPRPFWSHYIETAAFDGSFSTSNCFYRKEALIAVDGFDPSVTYWEDADLGWRVRRAGWQASFAPEALVYHQVIPLSIWQWLRWPLHFRYEPAKAARYPEYRRLLFLGIWVHWFHALFDLAVAGCLLSLLVRRGFAALGLPYVVAFVCRRGLRGRYPPAKAAAYLAWDACSLSTLLAASIRHRSVVL